MDIQNPFNFTPVYGTGSGNPGSGNAVFGATSRPTLTQQLLLPMLSDQFFGGRQLYFNPPPGISPADMSFIQREQTQAFLRMQDAMKQSMAIALTGSSSGASRLASDMLTGLAPINNMAGFNVDNAASFLFQNRDVFTPTGQFFSANNPGAQRFLTERARSAGQGIIDTIYGEDGLKDLELTRRKRGDEILELATELARGGADIFEKDRHGYVSRLKKDSFRSWARTSSTLIDVAGDMSIQDMAQTLKDASADSLKGVDPEVLNATLKRIAEIAKVLNLGSSAVIKAASAIQATTEATTGINIGLAAATSIQEGAVTQLSKAGISDPYQRMAYSAAKAQQFNVAMMSQSGAALSLLHNNADILPSDIRSAVLGGNVNADEALALVRQYMPSEVGRLKDPNYIRALASSRSVSQQDIYARALTTSLRRDRLAVGRRSYTSNAIQDAMQVYTAAGKPGEGYEALGTAFAATMDGGNLESFFVDGTDAEKAQGAATLKAMYQSSLKDSRGKSYLALSRLELQANQDPALRAALDRMKEDAAGKLAGNAASYATSPEALGNSVLRSQSLFLDKGFDSNRFLSLLKEGKQDEAVRFLGTGIAGGEAAAVRAFNNASNSAKIQADRLNEKSRLNSFHAAYPKMSSRQAAIQGYRDAQDLDKLVGSIVGNESTVFNLEEDFLKRAGLSKDAAWKLAEEAGSLSEDAFRAMYPGADDRDRILRLTKGSLKLSDLNKALVNKEAYKMKRAAGLAGVEVSKKDLLSVYKRESVEQLLSKMEKQVPLSSATKLHSAAMNMLGEARAEELMDSLGFIDNGGEWIARNGGTVTTGQIKEGTSRLLEIAKKVGIGAGINEQISTASALGISVKDAAIEAQETGAPITKEIVNREAGMRQQAHERAMESTSDAYNFGRTAWNVIKKAILNGPIPEIPPEYARTASGSRSGSEKRPESMRIEGTMRIVGNEAQFIQATGRTS